MRIDEFLLARVAEDEAVARAATRAPWRASLSFHATTVDADPVHFNDDGTITKLDRWERADGHVRVAAWVRGGGDYDADVDNPLLDFEHIVRHDPARVLAECEAKRRIVSLHGITETKSWTNPWDGPAYEETEHTCELCGWCDAPACLTLVSLAAVYADHPDFDPAWRL